jgi:hypothetical protein
VEQQDSLFIGALIIPLLLLVLKEVFSWFRQRNLQDSDKKILSIVEAIRTVSDRLEKTDIKLDNISQMNKIMFEWHDKSDEDGVKLWYVRRSLEEALHENVRAINILAKNSEVQTRLLEDMIKQNREMNKDQIIMSKLLERLAAK